MGLFGQGKKYDLDDGHNNDLFTDDDDFTVSFSRKRTFNSSNGKVSAPHAITAKELLENKPENIPMTGSHEAPSVYKILQDNKTKAEADAIGDDYVPSWAVLEPEKTETKQTAKTVEAPAPAAAAPVFSEETSGPADDFLKRCLSAIGGDESNPQQESVTGSAPLKTGSDGNGTYGLGAKYDLNAFAETAKERPTHNMAAAHSAIDADAIIRRLKGDGEDAAAAPVQESAANAADTANAAAAAPDDIPAATAVKEPSPAVPENKPQEIEMEHKAADDGAALQDGHRRLNVNVEVIPPDAPEKIMNTTMSTAAKDDVRVYGKIVNGTVIQSTPDGDVSDSKFVKAPPVPVSGETRVFDSALDDIMSSVPSVSEATRPISKAELYDDDLDDFPEDDDYDYDGEYDGGEKTPYYETEDTSLAGIADYKTLSDSAKLRVKYSGEFRVAKTVAVLSFIAAALAAGLSWLLGRFVPGIGASVATFALLAVCTVMNIDVFGSIKGLFLKHADFGCCVALCSAVSLVSGAVCTFAGGGKYPAAPVAAMLLLASYRSSVAIKAHRILRGLEVIGNSEGKRALSAVDDDTSDTLASGAIDGDALTVVGKKAVNIRSFVKNSSYKSPLDQRSAVMFIVGAAIAAAAGGITLYLSDIYTALTVMSLSLAACFPAAAAISNELTLGRIVKKLSAYDATIAGYKGAYDLNLSNVVAVGSSDIFPDGSVTLYSMKTLSSNEIGQSLADAAAVAIAAGSPLSGIFRSMLGDNGVSEMPKVGGVKYEDKMGLSGWIGDNTILIGNRNLMQGHNIPVPPVTVDQKILRAGYFPVYISCHGIPCILFIVKYEADPHVKAELQSLCSTGMTVAVYPEDPNTTDTMICDYFDLPSDAVSVMKHNARVAYEKEVEPTDTADADAVSKRHPAGLFSAVSMGIGLWKKLSTMTALVIVAAVLCGVLLVYLGATGKIALAASLAFSAYQLFFLLLAVLVSGQKR